MTDDDIEEASMGTLLSWWRFSPVGAVPNEKMKRIGERMREIEAAQPGATTSASKSIGW